jgi:cystathionine beta-lyase
MTKERGSNRFFIPDQVSISPMSKTVLPSDSPENLRKDRSDATLLAHEARGGIMPKSGLGTINPPIYRASTLTFDSLDTLSRVMPALRAEGRSGYGRSGSDSVWGFEDMLAKLDHAEGAICLESGLAAATITLTAFVEAGDHILVTDSVYAPVRSFCDEYLKRFGVSTTYYDPLISPHDLKALIQPNTRLLYMEAPGSLTFEMQDVVGLATVAREAGVVSAIDNTWATPLFFKPLDHGVDVSVQAGTKYIVGHSDAMLGVVAASGDILLALRKQAYLIGHRLAPDEAALALRGLRTMDVRLRHHQAAGLEMAAWFKQRPEVAAVLHPGLESDPGHQRFTQLFSGCSGLFSILLQPGTTQTQVAAFVDCLSLFSMGFSWGGYESLVVPQFPASVRTATTWPPSPELSGPMLRFHIGLEALDDLKADLARGFEALAAAG